MSYIHVIFIIKCEPTRVSRKGWAENRTGPKKPDQKQKRAEKRPTPSFKVAHSDFRDLTSVLDTSF